MGERWGKTVCGHAVALISRLSPSCVCVHVVCMRERAWKSKLVMQWLSERFGNRLHCEHIYCMVYIWSGLDGKTERTINLASFAGHT